MLRIGKSGYIFLRIELFQAEIWEDMHFKVKKWKFCIYWNLFKPWELVNHVIFSWELRNRPIFFWELRNGYLSLPNLKDRESGVFALKNWENVLKKVENWEFISPCPPAPVITVTFYLQSKFHSINKENPLPVNWFSLTVMVL